MYSFTFLLFRNVIWVRKFLHFPVIQMFDFLVRYFLVFIPNSLSPTLRPRACSKQQNSHAFLFLLAIHQLYVRRMSNYAILTSIHLQKIIQPFHYCKLIHLLKSELEYRQDFSHVFPNFLMSFSFIPGLSTVHIKLSLVLFSFDSSDSFPWVCDDLFLLKVFIIAFFSFNALAFVDVSIQIANLALLFRVVVLIAPFCLLIVTFLSSGPASLCKSLTIFAWHLIVCTLELILTTSIRVLKESFMRRGIMQLNMCAGIKLQNWQCLGMCN